MLILSWLFAWWPRWKAPTTTASVVTSTLSPNGARLTTLLLTMPRFVLAEFTRHRAFSLCVASSRAVPAKKDRAAVRVHPVWPLRFGKNAMGMSAGADLTGTRGVLGRVVWWLAMQAALVAHWACEKVGLHKQWTNRLLEPFQHVQVLVTSTDWRNFLAQRNHHEAQPEMEALARAVKQALIEAPSKGFRASYGQWHTPFIDEATASECFLRDALAAPALASAEHSPWKQVPLVLKVSAARCARLTTLTHLGSRSIDEDLKLWDKLVTRAEGSDSPPHLSPLEHVAEAMDCADGQRYANFRGWRQLRARFENNPDQQTTFSQLSEDLRGY